MTAARGTLVLVGTPIGNLGDLSPRAVETLAKADLIACEDTRRTRQLLSRHHIPAGHRLIAINEHNEAAQARRIGERLAAGEVVAVVSDAGMPAVSDPGERLVAAALATGHDVSVVPGPSAALAALVVSGLPTGRFVFEGFLPRSGRARAERLEALRDEPRTAVIFEAPHRVRETVAQLATALGGDRRVAVARELTKMFEEVWRGTLSDAAGHVAENEPRGEYVIVLDGAPAKEPPGMEAVEAALLVALEEGLDKRSAIARVVADLGVPKREVYAVATRLRASIRAGRVSPLGSLPPWPASTARRRSTT